MFNLHHGVNMFVEYCQSQWFTVQSVLRNTVADNVTLNDSAVTGRERWVETTNLEKGCWQAEPDPWWPDRSSTGAGTLES